MLRSEVTLLLAKAETAPGEPIATSADTDGGINAEDVVLKPDYDLSERVAQAGLGRLPGHRQWTLGTCSFGFEMTGKGTASGGSYAPWWAKTFLPMCAYIDNLNGTFTKSILPIAGSGSRPRSGTIRHYVDGRLEYLYGAAGTFTLVGEGGGPVRVELNLTGIYGEPSDAAVPEWTVPVGEDLIRFENCTTLVDGSWSPAISKLEIDVGNQVEARGLASAEMGVSYCRVAKGEPRGSFDPEAELVAAYALDNKTRNETEVAFSCQIGDTTGSKLTLASSYLQFEPAQPEDKDGIRIDQTAFRFNRNDDDGLTLTFA